MKKALILMQMLLLGSSLLTACGGKPSPVLNGYIEADTIRLASPVGGRLIALPLARGQDAQAGAVAFTLEQDSEKAAVAEAAARASQAEAQAADLQTGQRPQELAVHEANLRAARASLLQAEAELQRQSALADKGYAPATTLDALRARRDTAAAEVAQMRARLASARLGARELGQQAATSGAQAAREQLAQRLWLLSQKTIRIPVSGRIEEHYYRVGEWVPAGSPVLSLLAPAAIKARFYIPETRLAALPVGAPVLLSCDNCGQPVPATIRFVAREAEFTPPVIYNKDNRSRLVWLAEAVPSPADALRLRPGQPVDVIPVNPAPRQGPAHE